MSVSIIVPWQGGCPHREAAWEWVKARYVESHPAWGILIGRYAGDEWVKARAVTPAVRVCSSEIVVVADADAWSEGIGAAVEAVQSGAPWAMPHGKVHRLSEEGTAAVLRGASWEGQPLDQEPYRGAFGGGIVVLPRATYLQVPLDPRFVNWGQEDTSWDLALHSLAGKPWRGDADLIHLYHPPQERMTRVRGSNEGWKLQRRYRAARRDPERMRALLAEGVVDVAA